jgi:hypothetical protein
MEYQVNQRNPSQIYTAVPMGRFIQVGDTFQSRGGSQYKVTEVRAEGRAKGFTISRDSTGKEVRISEKLCRSSLTLLLSQGFLTYQANQKRGGISYTVAIEAGVVFALEGFLCRYDQNRQYVEMK